LVYHFLAAAAILAQSAPPDPDGDQETAAPATEIVVTGQRLDAARAKVEPALGASTYTLANDTIENRPGGETRTLGTILQQVPGVRSDGQGRLIVRGAPGGVQYRLNNVILPEGVADFGESLSARLADRTQLITGALPAQYGLAAGSVVNITTKSGLSQGNGGQAELYGGSHHTFEPAFELSTATGGTSLFASGSFRRSDVGLAAPDAREPLHDASRELEGFAFLDHVIDEDSRVSLILGSSNERKEVPGLPVAGIAGATSRHGIDKSNNHYAIASYQHIAGDLTVQASLSGLLSRSRVTPDEALSIAADGVARRRSDRRSGVGTQVETAYTQGDAHTLRAGLIASADRQRRDERFASAVTSAQSRATDRRLSTSLFVEDEWKITPQLTANLGLRADRVSGLDRPTHLGPRASLSWVAARGFTLHGGYARYFIAPPLGEARVGERDDYFDLGAERKIGDLTVGIDAYSRTARNQFAERNWPFGPIGDTFAYRRARSEGVELLTTYADGPVTAWANLALARSRGRGISVGRALFSPAQLVVTDHQSVRTELDQAITASAGASRRFGPLLLSADLLYGSGAPRTAPGDAIDGARLPAHATFDLAAVYRLKLIDGRPTDLRFDITNVGDRRYAFNDGTSLAGGAPQWAVGRGLFVGIEQGF
jgi:hypothetical protein